MGGPIGLTIAHLITDYPQTIAYVVVNAVISYVIARAFSKGTNEWGEEIIKQDTLATYFGGCFILIGCAMLMLFHPAF